MPTARRVPDEQWHWWLNTPESDAYLPHLEHGVATFQLQVGSRRVVEQDLEGDEDAFLQWSLRDQYVRPVQVLVGDEAAELPNLYFMFQGRLYEVQREEVPFSGDFDELWERERHRIREEAETAVRAAYVEERRSESA